MDDPNASQPAAIYARQSRGSRAELTSCEAQADICRDAATSRGWMVAQIFADEAGSSETLDRPAMQKLLDEIKAGKVKRLIVDRLDRLTRRLVDLLMLLELFDDHQVELEVVNDPHFSNSATSRLMTHIVAAASEFQLEITRERLADARAALKRKGKRVAGRVPFGYQADPNTKALVPHAEQAVVVRDFFKLAADGSKPSELATLATWRTPCPWQFQPAFSEIAAVGRQQSEEAFGLNRAEQLRIKENLGSKCGHGALGAPIGQYMMCHPCIGTS